MSDAPVLLAPADYVTLAFFSAISGYSVKACRRKIEDGFWLEGFEFVRAPDGRILISTEGYARWARGERR